MSFTNPPSSPTKKTVSTLPFNLDHKLVTTVVVGALTYLLVSVIGLDVSPELEAGISATVGAIVAYFVPPADTVIEP